VSFTASICVIKVELVIALPSRPAGAVADGKLNGVKEILDEDASPKESDANGLFVSFESFSVPPSFDFCPKPTEFPALKLENPDDPKEANGFLFSTDAFVVTIEEEDTLNRFDTAFADSDEAVRERDAKGLAGLDVATATFFVWIDTLVLGGSGSLEFTDRDIDAGSADSGAGPSTTEAEFVPF
jgi:hypothetical protein